jgi:uroporphyrinogen-III synthase
MSKAATSAKANAKTPPAKAAPTKPVPAAKSVPPPKAAAVKPAPAAKPAAAPAPSARPTPSAKPVAAPARPAAPAKAAKPPRPVRGARDNLRDADLPPPLTGVQLLVTRPVHQAERVSVLAQQAGAQVWRYPVVEIKEPTDARRVNLLLKHIEDYDTAIFISANAVNMGLQRMAAQKLRFPKHMTVAAIGQVTAQTLAAQGVVAELVAPSPYTTEAFLAMEEMDHMEGAQVLIFRGEGGREALANGLKARGAHVEYAEVYRRGKPAQPATVQYKSFRASPGAHAIMVTSEESLLNLLEMQTPAEREWVKKQMIVVGSRRVGEMALRAGIHIQQLLLAENATDEAMLQALITWRLPEPNAPALAAV